MAVNPDGSVTANLPNPAVPVDTLKEILQWRNGGAEEDDIIDRLRTRTVPEGYTPHPWSPGTVKSVYIRILSLDSTS